MDTILLPRDLLVDHASWMGSGMARRFVYVLPIGSMDGIYANIKGVYWWDPCYHIRRPRQMQGGARQGIILLTLVSDYCHLHYHGDFPAAVFWTEGAAAATAAAAVTSSSWTGWCFPIWQLSFEQKEQQQQQPAAAGLDGVFPSGNCFLECVSVEKYCFSRISDDTLGSFLAQFWH